MPDANSVFANSLVIFIKNFCSDDKEKSYLVESNIDPGIKYMVNSNNLISNASFTYDTDKFMYPSDNPNKRGESKMGMKEILSRQELERHMNIGIIERINSKFDKLINIFDSVDSLFSKRSNEESSHFLNEFISKIMLTLESLKGLITNTKSFSYYSPKILNIESRIVKLRFMILFMLLPPF